MNRRVLALGATCAVALGATGIAVAATRGGERQLQVVDKRVRVRATATDETPTTLSTTTLSTATDDLPSTTAAAVIAPETVDTTTTIGIPPPLAGATDLQGTISIASTLVAEEKSPVTVTLRNIADHPVSLVTPSDYTHYAGVAIEGNAVVTGGVPDDGDSNLVTLAVGEQRSFATTITPDPRSVGDATASAAMLFGTYFGRLAPSVSYHFIGVPSVPVLVIPPGAVPNGPVDASLGKWRAEVSSGAKAVAVGDIFVVHADLTNVGDRPQTTDGYGAIAIGCNDAPYAFLDSHFVGVMTIAPGDAKSFDFEFVALEHGPELCFAGIVFGEDTYDVGPRQGFETSTATIAILPPGTMIP